MVEQVQIPHSVVEGKVPAPNEVIVGGLAVNLKDGALYTKGYDDVVFQINRITFDQVVAALGFAPVEPAGVPLPPAATDLPTALDLLNSIRTLLIGSGMGA